jgi:Zinc finger C-x8-C-x5-C-x3-H type (and similar)/CCCH-type zinc finger
MAQVQFKIFVSKPPKQLVDYKAKLRTEICRNWGLGCCEFGDKCFFAHGYNELRSISSGSNYKTKKCKQFHEKGYCQYGNRCQFKHRDLSQETAADSPNSTPRDQFKEVNKKRLPVFLKLAPDNS